jgi:hypothetical protein
MPAPVPAWPVVDGKTRGPQGPGPGGEAAAGISDAMRLQDPEGEVCPPPRNPTLSRKAGGAQRGPDEKEGGAAGPPPKGGGGQWGGAAPPT